MSRGAAHGPVIGMGLDVESSGPGMGFPLGFGSSFGFRVSGWPVEGEYSTCVQVWSRGSCHFWGAGAMQQRRMVSFRGGQGGSRTAPTRRGARLQEGWVPASAGMTAGGGGPGSAGSAPSGGMVSRLGASATCLRRNDGGGWVRLVEVVQPGGVAADYLRLLVFRHPGKDLVQDLPRPGERRLRVRIVRPPHQVVYTYRSAVIDTPSVLLETDQDVGPEEVAGQYARLETAPSGPRWARCV